METTSPASLVINGVEVDLEGEVLRSPGGAAIELRPQAFATLRYLVGNANRLVSKAELHEAIWFGMAVTDDSLVQCVLPSAGRSATRPEPAADGVAARVSAEPAGAIAGGGGGASIAVLPFATEDGVETTSSTGWSRR